MEPDRHCLMITNFPAYFHWNPLRRPAGEGCLVLLAATPQFFSGSGGKMPAYLAPGKPWACFRHGTVQVTQKETTPEGVVQLLVRPEEFESPTF